MTTTVTISARVKNWNEPSSFDEGSAMRRARAEVILTLSGGAEGALFVDYLLAHRDDGSAEFVGIERFDCAIDGRVGTFLARSVGVFVGGVPTSELAILPDTGTGDFQGVTGSGRMMADESGATYELRLHH